MRRSRRSSALLDLVIATRNLHKVKELKRLLAVPGFRYRSLTEFPDAPAVRENGRTFETNAIKKARAAAAATGCLVIADDSGIEVNRLDGTPGVRSARFAGAHGDDDANNRKLLRLLNGVPMRERGARYQCVLALADPWRLIGVTYGAWSGRIATTPSGLRGFGYDPIFIVPKLGKTVGELPASTKRRLSHRAVAARRLRPLLRHYLAQAKSPARSVSVRVMSRRDPG